MVTKYIVDNLSDQTINGDLTINGNLSVTGVTTGSLVTYKALLTQTGPITGVNLNDFNYALIIGETYTIDNYVSGDSFNNVANVIDGNIDETGCVFIATGQTPTEWTNGSQLTSNGGLVVDVLENNLGYDLAWIWGAWPFGVGFYIAVNQVTGPSYNSFPRKNVMVTAQPTSPFGWGDTLISISPGVGTFDVLDELIFLRVTDWLSGPEPVDNNLYYTPVEINIKQDMTPITFSGSVVSSYPFSYPSITVLCDNNYVDSVYGDNVTVSNITELVTELNLNPSTKYLGTYSDDGAGGFLLSMPTYLANSYCPTGLITLEAFSN